MSGGGRDRLPKAGEAAWRGPPRRTIAHPDARTHSDLNRLLPIRAAFCKLPKLVN